MTADVFHILILKSVKRSTIRNAIEIIFFFSCKTMKSLGQSLHINRGLAPHLVASLVRGKVEATSDCCQAVQEGGDAPYHNIKNTKKNVR